MTYLLMDANGYVDDYASNTGARKMRELMELSDDEEVQFFLLEGYSPNPRRLKHGLEGLIDKAKDQFVKKTLLDLIRNLDDCDEIAIIWDGIE